jgi:hypothetical protein
MWIKYQENLCLAFQKALPFAQHTNQWVTYAPSNIKNNETYVFSNQVPIV